MTNQTQFNFKQASFLKFILILVFILVSTVFFSLSSFAITEQINDLTQLPYITQNLTTNSTILNSTNINSTLNNSTVILVGIKPIEPFIIANSSINPQGFSIDLIEEIVKGLNENNDLNKTFTIQYYYNTNLQKHLESVKTSKVDLGIAATTITSKRSEELEFSYPFYRSSIGILVLSDNNIKISTYLFNWENLKFIIIIFATIFIYSLIIWLNSRNLPLITSDGIKPKIIRNKKNKLINNRISFLESIKWVISTMIPTTETIHYSKINPKNNFGWFFAQIVVITGIIIFGFIFAKAASFLTINELTSSINGPADLVGAKVIVVAGTQSQQIANSKGYRTLVTNNFDEAILALEKKKGDAFIYDKPVLLYYLNENEKKNLILASEDFMPNNYGITFSKESKYRRLMNIELLELFENQKYQKINEKWFGTS